MRASLGHGGSTTSAVAGCFTPKSSSAIRIVWIMLAPVSLAIVATLALPASSGSAEGPHGENVGRPIPADLSLSTAERTARVFAVTTDPDDIVPSKLSVTCNLRLNDTNARKCNLVWKPHHEGNGVMRLHSYTTTGGHQYVRIRYFFRTKYHDCGPHLSCDVIDKGRARFPVQ